MVNQSLIDILNIWEEAVKLFERGDWTYSISKYQEIAIKSSRHLYNIACCQIQLGKLDDAIQTLSKTLSKDNHLVIAFVQRALCYHRLSRYVEACADLQKAHNLIGCRHFISYQPMGLHHKITNIEVMFNLAAVCSSAQHWDDARVWLSKARNGESRLGLAHIHNAVERTQKNQPIEPLPLPARAIFHPDQSMLDNQGKKNYLGQAKVIAEVKVTEVKDDLALRRNRLAVPGQVHDNHRRSKSRDSIPNDVTANNDDVRVPNVIKLDAKMLAELHREMPRAPPPRLVQRRDRGASPANQDVRNYPLPPPPRYPLRRGDIHRSEEIRAPERSCEESSEIWLKQVGSNDDGRMSGEGEASPLCVDNDPWRPVDESQITELESALKKQRLKMTDRNE